MKKLTILILISILINNLSAQGSFKVSGNKVQIGYQNYKWLGFGFKATSPTSNESQFAIEHDGKGLNFWKPVPSKNAGNNRLYISDDYKVGVGIGVNSFPSLDWNWHTFQVNGWGRMYGLVQYSDERIKKNFRTINTPVQKILALKAYQFDFDLSKMGDTLVDTTLTGYGYDSVEKKNGRGSYIPPQGMANRYGFKAQEVEQIFPDLIHQPTDPKGFKSMDYQGLIPILVEAIKEQEQTIQNLRQEIANWKGQSIDTPSDNTRLFQNNPNPFDGITHISYYIDENVTVNIATIEIRNIMGVLQNTITLNDISGMGSVEYEGSALNQGYYIYTLKVNHGVKDSKMFLKEN